MNGPPNMQIVNDAAVIEAFRRAILTEVANMGFSPGCISNEQLSNMAADVADVAHERIHEAVKFNDYQDPPSKS